MRSIKTMIATAALAAALGTATPARAETVLGLALGLSGSVAALGEQARRGAEAAVAAVNAQGGVLGEPVRLEVGDDACDPKQAVSVANRMVTSGIKIVLGHLCSGASIAASDVYAPISGEVVEGNAGLSDAPETVNAEPESAGWFAKVKVADTAEFDGLMDRAAYEDFLGTL